MPGRRSTQRTNENTVVSIDPNSTRQYLCSHICFVQHESISNRYSSISYGSCFCIGHKMEFALVKCPKPKYCVCARIRRDAGYVSEQQHEINRTLFYVLLKRTPSLLVPIILLLSFCQHSHQLRMVFG